MFKPLMTAAAIVALANGASLQAAETNRCISVEEAEALVTYVLPLAIDTAQTQCGDQLPAMAPLMQNGSDQYTDYVIASDQAWPTARGVIGVLAGDKLPEGMDMDSLRPMVDAMIPAMLAKEIKPDTCSTIDQVYGLLGPLPAQNVSSLVVMLMQLGQSPEKQRPLNICKVEQ